MLWLTSWTVASSSHLLKSKTKPCSRQLSTSRKSYWRTGTRPPIHWPVGIPRLAGVPEISVLEFRMPCSTHRVLNKKMLKCFPCIFRLPSFHLHGTSTGRSLVPYWSTVWWDDSRYQETLPALQEWHHRCTECPGPRCCHLHLLCCSVSRHHLWRIARCVFKSHETRHRLCVIL